jgi:hypothetical protein
MSPTVDVERPRDVMRARRDERDTDHDGEQSQSASGRPLGELVNDAWLKAELLIRQEISLGLTEIRERIDTIKADLEQDLAQWKRELMAKVAGGTLALIGLSTLTAALVLLLANATTPWLAASIVGAGMVIGGGLLLMRSMRTPTLHGRELIPKRTIQNIQQDTRNVKEAIK